MEFTLSEDLEEARKRAREFALNEFTEELAAYYDREEKYPDEIRKKVFNSGFMDPSNPWLLLVAMEEFCRVDPGLGLSALASVFGSEILLLHGTDEQRERFMTRVWKGELISGFAITERNSGISTKMEKKDSKWVLDGTKMFVTNGDVADYFLTLVRTSPPEGEKWHHGLSVVIVERSMPGLSSKQIKGKMGVRSTDTAELSFNGVIIPEENIVGEIGKGFYYMLEFFNISRVFVAAQGVGIAQGALDRLYDYLFRSKKAGSRLPGYESTAFTVAEVLSRIEPARVLTYKAASLLFKFTPDPVITSIAKYYSADAATYATEKAMELMGIDGITTSLERLYRDAKITEIWEGTNEIEKLTIARLAMKNRVG